MVLLVPFGSLSDGGIGWHVLFLGSCPIWCPSGLCSGPSPIYPIHSLILLVCFLNTLPLATFMLTTSRLMFMVLLLNSLILLHLLHLLLLILILGCLLIVCHLIQGPTDLARHSSTTRVGWGKMPTLNEKCSNIFFFHI